MSNYVFQKSIAATLGIAIASTGILLGISGHAQDSMPGKITQPSPSPTMMPSKTPSGTMSQPAMSKPAKTPATSAKKMTIVDVAVKSGSFKTLVAALKAADLVETLSGEGPFTVFAPTDAAFAKLPKGTLQSLLKPENKAKLTQILTYHVVSGAILSKDIKSGNVATVESSEVAVKVKGKRVMVNNAKVIKADIKTSNGVIHVIDRVIMPPAK